MNLAVQTLLLASEDAVSSERFRHLLASGGQLVDVRSPVDFERDALPGALNLPMDALAYGYGYTRLNRHRPVILCASNGIHCFHAAQLLAGEGFSQIYHLTLH